MADYHAVLKRAIDALPENTGAARRAVYQRARSAIVNQLKSYEPPLSPSDITTEQLRLEEAIRKVEADAARASLGLGPASRPASEASKPRESSKSTPSPAEKPARVAAGEVRSVARNEPQATSGSQSAGAPQGANADAPRAKASIAPAETALQPPASSNEAAAIVDARIESPAPSIGNRPFNAKPAHQDKATHAPAKRPARPQDPANPQPAPQVNQQGAAPPQGPVNAETAGQGDERSFAGMDTLNRGAEPVSPGADYSRDYVRPSRLPTVAAAIAAVVVFVGLLGFAYTQRDAILAMMQASENQADTRTPAATKTAEPSAEDSNNKNNARLLGGDDDSATASDARTVTTTRVVPPSGESGVTVAPQGSEPDTFANSDTGVDANNTANDTSASASDSAGNASPEGAASDAAAQATPVAQRSILYEESTDESSGGTAEQGRVIWSTAMQPQPDGGGSDTVIEANVTIPGRGITLSLSIAPNRDETLSASQLIEMRFSLPKDFPGKGVASVPGLIMKTTEEARGDALIGASVRVSDGLFWVALSSIEAERKRNETLLRDRGWIDIPILYENGKRAILTLEKGLPGERAVQSALNSWSGG